MIDKELVLKKIKELGIKIDHDVSFGGKSRGNKHLSRVVRVAKFLANKCGADEFIAVAGAALHDTALPTGNDYDYVKNKKVIKKLLKKFDLSLQDVERIAECVASHEGTVKPKSLEAQVVHDADVLEKVGLLGVIRHTWKLTNFNKINPQNIRDHDVKTVFDHIEWRKKKLLTPTAIKIASYLSVQLEKEKAKLIVSMSATLAARGVVTEKIATGLYKHLSQKEKDKLREQLNLSYLRKLR